MSEEHVIAFLHSMEQPEMADEVLNMHNRLEAFANGLDRQCHEVLLSRISDLEKRKAEMMHFVNEYLEAWEEGMAGDSYLLRMAQWLKSKEST